MPEFKQKPGRTRATLIHDTGEREDDALSRLQWVVPAVFLGALLILFFTIMEWLNPLVPTLLFFGLIWLPVSVWLVARRPRASVQAKALVVLSLASFALPLMAWNIGPYRAGVLWVLSEVTPVEFSVDAIGDRSDWVVLIACHQMLTTDRTLSTQSLRNVLEVRPEVAVRCLDGLDEEYRTQAIHTARHLRDTWYAQWMDPRTEVVDEDLGCRTALHFRPLASIYGSPGTPDLLMCTMTSPNRTIARCCGEVLSSELSQEEILDVTPHAWLQEVELPLFRALNEAVDLPAHTLMSSEPIDPALRWTPGDLFHWTTHLGCYLIDEHESPEQVARRLSRSIETQCGLEVEDPLFSFEAVRFVERTCRGIERSQTDQVDVVHWCNVAREANRATAVDTAKFLVYRATRLHEVLGLYDHVAVGAERAGSQARYDALYGRDERAQRRYDQGTGTGGMRLHRASWADHTPEARDRLQRRRAEDMRRREASRQRILEERRHDISDEELTREVDLETIENRRSRFDNFLEEYGGRPSGQ